MLEDDSTFVERRLTPRIKMTVRRHIAYWVAMSAARRAIASLGVAAVIGGATFGACRASDITAPNFKSQSGLSRSLTSSDGSLLDSDEDSDNWQLAPSTKQEIRPEDAEADPEFQTSTETTFPVTETAYNTCRNEGPIVLNGELKSRMRLKVDEDGINFRLREFKDTRGVFATFTYEEDYYDDDDDTWKKRTRVVKYQNKQTLLDRFEAGPIGLPFRSEFESKMLLQRQGDDDGDGDYDGWKPGDDLFVFVKEKVKVGLNGDIRTEFEFRTECK